AEIVAGGQGGAGSPGAGARGGASGAASGGAAGDPSANPYFFVSDAGAPANIAVDSKYLYWSRAESIMRVSVRGGQPQAVAPGSFNARLAVDSEGSLYWW